MPIGARCRERPGASQEFESDWMVRDADAQRVAVARDRPAAASKLQTIESAPGQNAAASVRAAAFSSTSSSMAASVAARSVSEPVRTPFDGVDAAEEDVLAGSHPNP